MSNSFDIIDINNLTKETSVSASSLFPMTDASGNLRTIRADALALGLMALSGVMIKTQTVDNISIAASSSAVANFNQFPDKSGFQRVVIAQSFQNASSNGLGYSGITKYCDEFPVEGVKQYLHNFYTSAAKIRMTITVAYFPTSWYK